MRTPEAGERIKRLWTLEKLPSLKQLLKRIVMVKPAVELKYQDNLFQTLYDYLFYIKAGIGLAW
jgi:hypothetical protein